jgi:hypothetical protein
MKNPSLRTYCCLSVLSLASGALTALPTPAAAQAVGPEFQINTYTTARQETKSSGSRVVAADASGNFVVVWESNSDQDGDSVGIFGQRYESTGAVLGSEFQVNSYTTERQRYPSVAAAAEGHFVVAWSGMGKGEENIEGTGIFGQRYDNAGGKLGREFRVNSYTTGFQDFPSVASDASGNFVIVWEGHGPSDSQGIFGRRYDSGGVAQGAEFRVNTHTDYSQKRPTVAAAANGDFVVAWESNQQRPHLYGLFGRRYDSSGVAQGEEFQISPAGFQGSPSVASDANGNFVVVWYAFDIGILGQRYDSAGNALGGVFLINSSTTCCQLFPSVASDASGNFVVVWNGPGQNDDVGIFGQRYDCAGVAQGDEFQINSYTTNDQLYPSVGITGASQFVVAWQSYRLDGGQSDVFGQRFDFATTITVKSPNTNVKWRIGSREKIQWTHNLGRNSTFRIELDRDDDGVYEELIAAHADVDSATRGSFAWTVTGLPSATARVRVSWTDDLAVSDAGDVTFQIRPVPLNPAQEES